MAAFLNSSPCETPEKDPRQTQEISMTLNELCDDCKSLTVLHEGL